MESSETQKPRIGILTLTPTSHVHKYVAEGKYKVNKGSIGKSEIQDVLEVATFIDLNYINYAKLGGMEPVPLLLDDTEEETLAQLETLNGVLLTGGAEIMYDVMEFQSDKATHYQRRVRFLLEQTKRINDSGRYFILYAICLGYESLLSAENNNKCMLKTVDHQVKAYKGNQLLKGAETTRFCSYLAQDVDLLEQPINYFYHKYGVLLEDFYECEGLSEKMQAFSYIPLDNGFNVLTGAEYKDYPIYLVLFHPEKVQPIGDTALDEKRKYLQEKLTKYINIEIKRAGASYYKGPIRQPVLELEFPGHYGVRYLYIKEKS